MAPVDVPTIKVLFTLHPGFEVLDFTGPLDVLAKAKHDINDDCKLLFQSQWISADP